MSRGFEDRGFNLKVSDSNDFANFIQPVTGDGDAAVYRGT
jgi:hypothetical protein